MEKKVYLGILHKNMHLYTGRKLFHMLPLCKLEKGTLRLGARYSPEDPHLARYSTVILSAR